MNILAASRLTVSLNKVYRNKKNSNDFIIYFCYQVLNGQRTSISVQKKNHPAINTVRIFNICVRQIFYNLYLPYNPMVHIQNDPYHIGLFPSFSAEHRILKEFCIFQCKFSNGPFENLFKDSSFCQIFDFSRIPNLELFTFP